MYENILSTIKKMDTVENIGKIENIVGMSMEASGTGKSSIGDICMIYSDETESQVAAEVVGFKGDRVQLMTYKTSVGITSGAFVRNTRRRLRVPVGDFLKGRIIDAQGNPMDGGEPFPESDFYTVNNSYMNPLDRPPIRERLHFGIKAIDGLNTVGKGQRIGIFAGSGVGKSTLMGMIARNVKTDINVIALVGERGREILEFVEKDMGEEGMKRTGGGYLRPACHASFKGSSCGHNHCGIFPGQGHGCAFNDGLLNPFCHGPKRNRSGYRRASYCQRLYSLDLCGVPPFTGAGGRL